MKFRKYLVIFLISQVFLLAFFYFGGYNISLTIRKLNEFHEEYQIDSNEEYEEKLKQTKLLILIEEPDFDYRITHRTIFSQFQNITETRKNRIG